VSELARRLAGIRDRQAPPDPEAFQAALARAREALAAEPPEARPADARGLPGGLLRLAADLPTVLVPDLHARLDFFLGMLEWRPDGEASVLERLEAGGLQVLCLGDGMHAESRAARRWKAAQKEFEEGYRRHARMDEEMRESLGLMEMVMAVKSAAPGGFHFLKGNHENIANEEGGGNHPFVKFALEGFMVAEYMRRFYGEEVLESHYGFEKDLPLLAVGRGFLASHAEPAAFHPEERVVGFRDDPQVVLDLTWTGDGEAEAGSVGRMLEHYLGPGGEGYYFGGHRPVREGYRLRADGRYVQIHDPERWVVALLPADGAIQPERDILDIGEVGE
jgi:hypothetical protein